MKLIRKPSAWLPFLLSGTALALLLVCWVFFSVQGRQSDEGTVARIFQLLLICQAIISLFFVLKWGRKELREALFIFLLQVLGALVPVAIVLLLERSF